MRLNIINMILRIPFDFNYDLLHITFKHPFNKIINIFYQPVYIAQC